VCGCVLRTKNEYESSRRLLPGEKLPTLKSGYPDERSSCPLQLRLESDNRERRCMLLEHTPSSNVQLSQISLSHSGWESMTLWLATEADASVPRRPKHGNSVFRGDWVCISTLHVNNWFVVVCLQTATNTRAGPAFNLCWQWLWLQPWSSERVPHSDGVGSDPGSFSLLWMCLTLTQADVTCDLRDVLDPTKLLRSSQSCALLFHSVDQASRLGGPPETRKCLAMQETVRCLLLWSF